MSPERELVEKFKEAVETLKVEAIFPYLADEVTYELLPSTFVVVLDGGNSCILNAMMQGREEAYQGRMD